MNQQQLLDNLKGKFPDEAITAVDDVRPLCVNIPKAALVDICQYLHQQEGLYFDMLANITGMDNGPEGGTMEVIYNLNSIPYNHQLALKVTLQRNEESLQVPSVSSIWRTAEWHEREVYDLFGIIFTDHPDLRRILLPSDWRGHPLRKDYENLETYHGIIVD